MHYDKPARFLTNIKDECVPLIEQAARNTNFPVFVSAPLGDFTQGYQGVYTRNPGTEHRPFWREYERLLTGAAT